MIGRVSVYINLIISAIIMMFGFYSLFTRGRVEKDDIMAFAFITCVYGICILFDIYCINLHRNNYNYRLNSKGLLIKGKVLFVLEILATLGSLLLFLSLIYSFSIIQKERPKSLIIIQIFTVLILLLHTISAIISLIQYKKLIKINKSLQTDIVNTIGDNML